MRTTRFTLLYWLLSVSAFSIQAAEPLVEGSWFRVFKHDNGSESYIERESIRDNGEYFEYLSYTDLLIAEAVSLSRINCKTRKQATVAVQYVHTYIEKPSFGPYKEPKWRPIPPGSMGEAALNYLCTTNHQHE